MALLSFPAGDNSTDTIVSGVHFNLTTLHHFNYSLYSNDTFSNGSRCLLMFNPYVPHILLQNGTFYNSTSCYSPIRSIQTRSKIGLFFAAFFCISIVLTLSNLRKHGQLFLPVEKRFLPVGRRWQWYWMLIVAVFGIISSITNVDVDRYYLPELPLALSSVFWSLILPTTMCIVWESVRNWGSWQERQMVDDSSRTLRQDNLRDKVTLCIPLLFYLFIVLNTLLVLPRSWGTIELQRDSEQSRLRAEPAATDTRFKIAAFMLLGAWLTIAFSLYHGGRFSQTFTLIVPTKFALALGLSLVMICYEIAYSFYFWMSPMNIYGDLCMMYGLGWGSISLIFVVFEIYGYLEPNEDRALIRQRRLRNTSLDQELRTTTMNHPNSLGDSGSDNHRSSFNVPNSVGDRGSINHRSPVNDPQRIRSMLDI